MSPELRKLKTARLVLKVYAYPVYIRAALFVFFMRPVMRMATRAADDLKRKVVTLKALRSSLVQRHDELSRQYAQKDNLSPEEQAKLSAAFDIMKKETESCGLIRRRAQPSWAFTHALPILERMLSSEASRGERRGRKIQSFLRLVQQPESETFFFDLLLWFALPLSFSESALGDLKEELPLKTEELGRAAARTWYRHQAVSTLRACMWEKLERLATLATLIDQIRRWRGK